MVATRSRDTSADADAVYRQVLGRMDASRKAQMVFELSDNVRAATEAGIRLRHPEYNDRQIRLAATRLAIGEELFRLAFPNEDVRP
jgi:hypothetical protein